MSASALISLLQDQGGNDAAMNMAMEEWVEDNLGKNCELQWNLDDIRRIFEQWHGDASRSDAVECFAGAFKNIGGTCTCAAVACVIRTTDNDSVRQDMIGKCHATTPIARSLLLLTHPSTEYLAPCVRDPNNRQIILNVFTNDAVKMMVEDIELGAD